MADEVSRKESDYYFVSKCQFVRGQCSRLFIVRGTDPDAKVRAGFVFLLPVSTLLPTFYPDASVLDFKSFCRIININRHVSLAGFLSFMGL